jgi:hypothetical protein
MIDEPWKVKVDILAALGWYGEAVQTLHDAKEAAHVMYPDLGEKDFDFTKKIEQLKVEADKVLFSFLLVLSKKTYLFCE